MRHWLGNRFAASWNAHVSEKAADTGLEDPLRNPSHHIGDHPRGEDECAEQICDDAAREIDRRGPDRRSNPQIRPCLERSEQQGSERLYSQSGDAENPSSSNATAVTADKM
ncbi:hypothetical protein [Coriobacterium glomerans]|uniref:hypothetical protein n=1 Tax=Coriobacterium glomerans TaxID=33871 RepID=UPI00155A8C0C|nr:hypothetical protein [Coriobacterium glomerans]